MKKFAFLLIMLFVISICSYGQKANSHKLNPSPQDRIEVFKKSDIIANKDLLDIGDTLWFEDFGGGSVPAGWEVYDSTNNNFNWKWSDVGPNGAWTYPSGSDWPAHISPINSTTSSNGFMMLPSDNYNTNQTTGEMTSPIVTMNAYFKTSAIDCSSDTSVMVIFQQLFRFCCSESDAVFSLGVSNNDTIWHEFDIRHGIIGNKVTDDPDIVKVNITDLAAGHSTVYLRFWQTGVSHYYWMIDDIALVVAPDNDLQVDHTFISAIATYPNGSDFHGFYSKIPVSQIVPLFYQADAKNFGNDIQTDVTLTVDVFDEDSALVFTGTDDTVQLSKDSIASLVLADYYTPVGPGIFSSHFQISQDQADDLPENNVYDAAKYEVTDNKIFARDADRNTTVSVSQYQNWTDGDFVGNTYFITNSENVTSLSMYISTSSDLGETVVPQVHINNGAAWNDYSLQIDGDEHEIVAEDLGTWITLDLIPYAAGSETLLPQTEYCAGIEMYIGENHELYLGADDDIYTHMFDYEARLRIAGDWGWISKAACVRMNLEGAILPPKFISAPNKIIYTGGYDYNVIVTDPNGLSVTITATDIPDGMIITDNGDNTATVTGYPTGSAVNDSVFISLNADNGTAQNEQNYYAKIWLGMENYNPTTICIYPNPSKGIVNITNATDSHISVYNIVGELVNEIVQAKDINKIDLSPYGSGTYIVKVISGDNVITKKVSILK